jgi:hypothetical protein
VTRRKLLFEKELEKVELRKTFAELASPNDGHEQHSTTRTLLNLYSRLRILKRTSQKVIPGVQPLTETAPGYLVERGDLSLDETEKGLGQMLLC